MRDFIYKHCISTKGSNGDLYVTPLTLYILESIFVQVNKVQHETGLTEALSSDAVH